MKHIFALALLSLAFFSCEKTITLDLDQTEPVVVIEALLTDQPGRQFVKLSRTIGFNDQGTTPGISEAEVHISGPEGTVYQFQESEVGYYLPVDDFKGHVGEEYTLTIKADGQTYTATETMYYVPPFDSLSSRIDLDEQLDPEDEGYFYEVLFYIKEPKETKDYYLVKFLRNDTIQNWNGDGVFYTNDEFLNDEINALPAPIYYAHGDIATVEMYSISRDGYIYFLDLESNINSDGGMFEGTPSNIRTNIEGGAVGYFQVSSLTTSTIEVLD